jgi:phosphate transport system substrate-binding protein
VKRLNLKWLSVILSTLLITGLTVGCGESTGTTKPTTQPTASTSVNLNAAGATFPQPLYTKWFNIYAGLTGTKVNYQGIGSGGGIQQITAGTVDFAASDAIMTESQIAAAEKAGGEVLHIPMTLGAVAIIYNITGVNTSIKLTSGVLSGIYLGTITKWNDPAITALNTGVNLPKQDIVTVHRSDGSGTTFIFTNYLSKVSTQWQSNVGSATAVAWPNGVGGQGSAGVSGQVQQLPGAIGYVELVYATQNNLTVAAIQNSAGSFIQPTVTNTSAAAVGVALPADMKILLTNSPNADAYPIAGFTWQLVSRNQKDQIKGKAIVDLLWWEIHDGQSYSANLGYAPMPSEAIANAEKQIQSITFNGVPLRP